MSAANPATHTRARTRAIDLSAPVDTGLIRGAADLHPVATMPDVERDTRRKLAEFWNLNIVANSAKAAAEKAKKELLVLMSKANVPSLVEPVVVGANTIPVRAEVGEFPEDYIDVVLLREKVSDEIFMKIVGASMKNVTDYAGNNLKDACTKTRLKESALKIGVVK